MLINQLIKNIKKFQEFTKYIDNEVDSLKISFVKNKRQIELFYLWYER
jgi:hypothetical protein